jgi:hypothetical protein
VAGRTLVLPGPLERRIVKERGGSLLIEVAEDRLRVCRSWQSLDPQPLVRCPIDGRGVIGERAGILSTACAHRRESHRKNAEIFPSCHSYTQCLFPNYRAKMRFCPIARASHASPIPPSPINEIISYDPGCLPGDEQHFITVVTGPMLFTPECLKPPPMGK